MLCVGEECLLTAKELRQVEQTIKRLMGSTGVQSGYQTGIDRKESRVSPVDQQGTQA